MKAIIVTTVPMGITVENEAHKNIELRASE
jgi:hypothetical protein